MKKHEIKRFPLSDTTLHALDEEEKEYRVNDGNNLYFVVNPNGKKRWELRYKRPSDGKWTWLGLGSHSTVSGKLARQKAAELRKIISEGQDPKVIKDSQKKAISDTELFTFQKLAEDFCASKKWTPETRSRNEGALKNHIYPIMGNRDYRSIKRIEWLNLFKKIQEKPHPRTGKPIVEMANRLCALCKEIYDDPEFLDKVESNPISGIRKKLEKHIPENMPHVAEHELPELIAKIKNYPSKSTSIGLQLAIMLGTRPSEMSKAKWEEFDFKNLIWIIPKNRMKNRKEHTIPLPKQALELLNELKTITSNSPFLFHGRSSKYQTISNNTFNKALKIMGYAGRQTPHGFRHILSTILREKGFRREYVETALSHTVGGVEGVYNKAQYLKQRAVMMQKWANYLDNLANNSDNALDFENTDIFDSLENMGLTDDQKNLISKVIEQLLTDTL